jgi:hypothetical protein
MIYTKEQAQAEFKACFLDNPFFSEAVSYTASGQAAKSIKAVISRRNIKQTGLSNYGGPGSQIARYDREIVISTDATDGIAAVTEKGDKVGIPLDIGDAANVVFHVAAIIRQDLATWRLGLSR